MGDSMHVGVRIATGLTVVTLLALTGCGVDPSKGGGKPGGGQPGKSAGAVTTPPAPKAEFVPLDASLLTGAQTVTYTDETRKISASVPYLPAARTLTSAMEVVREKSLRTAATQNATAATITSQIVASSPSAVGIEVMATMTTDKGEVANPSLVWYDPGAKRVYSSPILVDAQQWGAFKNAVTKVVGKGVDAKRLSQAMDAPAAPEGTGPELGFDKEGNLVARFAAGAVSDQAYGLVVPAAQVEPLLSSFGRQAQAATKTPSAFDPKAPAPAATTGASASPAATATPGNQVPRPSTAVGVDCTKVKCVALTYDDGPGATVNKVVEEFLKAGQAATFFQLSPMLKENRSNAFMIASSGMEIGDHTITHNDLARMSPDKARNEIEGAAAAMKEIYGRPPMLLRPPYGSHNKASDEIAAKANMAVIQWSVDTNDWKTKNTMSTEAAASAAKPNDIVLMHDIHESTVAAAPNIIHDLTAKGLTLVTVSELSLNSGGYEAGHGYCTIAGQKQSGFGCTG